MSAFSILQYPDPRLRKKSKPVQTISAELHNLLDDMIEMMYRAKGVGLAAPQVGVNKRVIVLDTTPREDGEVRDRTYPDLIVLINPEIISKQGEILYEEGCLSVPGFVADVKRHAEVLVKGLDWDGNSIEVEGTELLSRALQHEIDHLNGVLFFDRLRRLKRELLVKKLNKAFPVQKIAQKKSLVTQ